MLEVDKRITIGLVGCAHDPESRHGPHTIFTSIRPQDNVTHRLFSEEQSNNSRVDDLTKLEELHEAAVIQSMKNQQAMRQYHVHNISSHSFKVGDFILQKIQMTKDRHKLSPVWEGTFEVVEVTWPSSYRLQ
jgi:hypothetical protein